jgi:hypothetical protein
MRLNDLALVTLLNQKFLFVFFGSWYKQLLHLTHESTED